MSEAEWTIDVVCSAESHVGKVAKLMRFVYVPTDPRRWDRDSTGGRDLLRQMQGQVVDTPLAGQTVARKKLDTGSADRQPDHNTRKIRCPLCGLDVTVRTELFDAVLDRLRHAGVDRIELAHLVAILT